MEEEEMVEIEVSLEVLALLDDLKVHPDESYNSVIKRLLLQYLQHHQL